MEPGRTLVVADWTVDPQAVVDAVRRLAGAGARRVALLVPAWLHGLDRAGDPHASRPCAEAQLAHITYLSGRAGLDFDVAEVGDPDPITAIIAAEARRGSPRCAHSSDLASSRAPR